MQFNEILKELREEKNLTQKQVADNCKVSPTCICQLETGMRSPTGTTLNALADFFECSVDYLLGRADDFGNVTVKKDSSPGLTPEEELLLANFRSLPRPERAQASEYIHFLAERKGNQNKHA